MTLGQHCRRAKCRAFTVQCTVLCTDYRTYISCNCVICERKCDLCLCIVYAVACTEQSTDYTLQSRVISGDWSKLMDITRRVFSIVEQDC